jgi:hypothetical protein
MVISHIFFYIKSVINELLLRWIISCVIGFLNGVNTPAGDDVAKRILAVKGSLLGFETNPFAWFAYFAVHLIRPAATFSRSDAEKGLFCGTFSRRSAIASANTGLIAVTPSAYLNLCSSCGSFISRFTLSGLRPPSPQSGEGIYFPSFRAENF